MNPLNGEFWAYIPGFGNKYVVSTTGKVVNTRLNKAIVGSVKPNGAIRVQLSRNDGTVLDTTIQRLIVDVFNTRLKGKKRMLKEDLDKGLFDWKHLPSRVGVDSAPVLKKYVWDSVFDVYYETVDEAAEALNVTKSYIYKVLRGDKSHVQGHKFEYKFKTGMNL